MCSVFRYAVDLQMDTAFMEISDGSRINDENPVPDYSDVVRTVHSSTITGVECVMENWLACMADIKDVNIASLVRGKNVSAPAHHPIDAVDAWPILDPLCDSWPCWIADVDSQQVSCSQ